MHWRRKTVGSDQFLIHKMQRKLSLLQAQEDSIAASEIKILKLDLQVLLDNEELWWRQLAKEELWWRQRAKEEWLKFGDHNTKYYHVCANAK
jgi:hypothetical protein